MQEEKDKTSQSNSVGSADRTPERYSNEADFFLYYTNKKINKIASAVHLITNFLSDKEPLRRHLRETSLSLLECGTSLGGTPSDKSYQEPLQNIVRLLNEIVSLIEVAALSKIISEMNASILRKECAVLVRMVEERYRSTVDERGNFLFSQNFFSVSDYGEYSQDKAIRQSMEQKDTHRQGHGSLSDRLDHEKDRLYQTDYKRQKPVYESEEPSDMVLNGAALERAKKRVYEKSARKKQSRRSALINALKQHDWASIKDLVPLIEGCSEKTIQRDILELVDEGLVAKEGERRWSRYSLQKSQKDI